MLLRWSCALVLLLLVPLACAQPFDGDRATVPSDAQEETAGGTSSSELLFYLFVILVASVGALAYWWWTQGRNRRDAHTAAHEKDRAELAEQYTAADELLPIAARLRRKGLSDKEVLMTLTQQGWRKEVLRDVLREVSERSSPPEGPASIDQEEPPAPPR